MLMNSIRAENGDYFRFGTSENTFNRRLILRPTAKVGRIYPINLMTNIVGVVPLARGKIHGRTHIRKGNGEGTS